MRLKLEEGELLQFVCDGLEGTHKKNKNKKNNIYIFFFSRSELWGPVFFLLIGDGININFFNSKKFLIPGIGVPPPPSLTTWSISQIGALIKHSYENACN